MDDPAIKDRYEEAKHKAKALYRSVGRVRCAALGEHIAFTKAGLRHLLRKGKKRHSRREQMRRFMLLTYAKAIVESRDVRVTHKTGKTNNLVKQHDTKILTESPADFWAISKKYGNAVITVIIRQTRTQGKHFFSIYDKKMKNQKNRQMTVV